MSERVHETVYDNFLSAAHFLYHVCLMFWLSPVIFMFRGNDINGEKILISQLIKNSRYLPFHAVKLCGIYCCFLSVSHTHKPAHTFCIF